MGGTLTTIIDPKCALPEWQAAVEKDRGTTLKEVKRCRRYSSFFSILMLNIVLIGIAIALYFLFRYLKNKDRQDTKYVQTIDNIQYWTFIIMLIIGVLSWSLVLFAPIMAAIDIKKHWAQIDSMGIEKYTKIMERAMVTEKFKNV